MNVAFEKTEKCFLLFSPCSCRHQAADSFFFVSFKLTTWVDRRISATNHSKDGMNFYDKHNLHSFGLYRMCHNPYSSWCSQFFTVYIEIIKFHSLLIYISFLLCILCIVATLIIVIFPNRSTDLFIFHYVVWCCRD